MSGRTWGEAFPRGRQRTGGAKWRQTGGGMGKQSHRVPMVTSMPWVGAASGVRRGRAKLGFNFQGGVSRSSNMQGMRARTGGFTGIERKFYDTKLSAGVLQAPGDASQGEQDESATISLCTVKQGDGESERDGRKCTFQSAYVKGVIESPNSNLDTIVTDPVKIYVALVLDTQTNGTQIKSEEVFVNQSGNSVLAASPMRNMAFTQRFRVLDTFECVLVHHAAANNNAATTVSTAGATQPFTLSTNLEFSTQYSGTTETIANITDNSLHVIAFCNDIQTIPVIRYNARVRFVG